MTNFDKLGMNSKKHACYTDNLLLEAIQYIFEPNFKSSILPLQPPPFSQL